MSAMSQVEVTNQSAYPWQSVVFITATYANGEISCGSGVMVGPNDVLTAAHVVYDSATGQAPVSVTVTPAYDPDPYEAPFGTIDAVSWNYYTDFDPDGDNTLDVGNGGEGLGGTELDVALINLDVPIGYETGWMGLDPNFEEGYVNITGHPGVYNFNMMNDSGWVEDDPVDYYMDITGLEHHPGNSGGPIWYEENGVPYVVGITSTTVAAHDIAATYDTLVEWIAGNDYLIAGA